jgi:hypothetical protein
MLEDVMIRFEDERFSVYVPGAGEDGLPVRVRFMDHEGAEALVSAIRKIADRAVIEAVLAPPLPPVPPVLLGPPLEGESWLERHAWPFILGACAGAVLAVLGRS